MRSPHVHRTFTALQPRENETSRQSAQVTVRRKWNEFQLEIIPTIILRVCVKISTQETVVREWQTVKFAAFYKEGLEKFGCATSESPSEDINP